MTRASCRIPILASRHIDVLRNAARGGQERFLVALSDRLERSRIAGALTSEGFVLEVESTLRGAGAAGRRVVRRGDPRCPPERLDVERRRDPLAASRELRPFTRRGAHHARAIPTRCGEAFGARGRRRAAAPAARGRRAAARVHQAAGGLPALAHARAAGAQRLRGRQATSSRAMDPALAAALDDLAREAAARAGDRRAGRRRAGARRGRAGRRGRTPDAVVVEVRPSATRSTRGSPRRGRARRGAARSSSSTPRPRPSGCATRHLRRRARLPAARRARAFWAASRPRRRRAGTARRWACASSRCWRATAS